MTYKLKMKMFIKLVAGNKFSIYESHFNELEKEGIVSAGDAARFLKTSGLSDALLSKIWDLSDPNSQGFLTKAGFFTALKLVSLAQLGQEVNMANILLPAPPPKFEGGGPGGNLSRRESNTTPVLPTDPPGTAPVATSDWAMTTLERVKYEQLFDSLQPVNGVIPGNKVKGLLIDSKLPVATLGRIWDLADMDKDGSLDKHEFTVAMHLVYKALEKYAIPNSLPPELLPPGKKDAKNLANQTIMNGCASWVVSPDEKLKFDNLFMLADVDKDGYVSGNEIKDVFLRSGVPQNILANIWGLCDMKQSGKLNAEQFALAMWFIQKKIKSGIDPPATLTPEMIPPSMRSQMNHEVAPNPDTNPELEMIRNDIADLVKEKHMLEAEILQKEAEIKIKSSEAKSLQGELDTLAATLKQLENQKGEAQKRLNDLKNQVEKLRKDAEEQVALVKSQEEELMSKKQELENLKLEESRLNAQQNELNAKLNLLSNSLQESQLSISQVKTKILQIQEHQFQLKEAITAVDNALGSGDNSSVSQRYLELEPEFRDLSYTRLITNNQINSELSAPTSHVVEDNRNIIQSKAFPQNGFDDDQFTSSTGGFADFHSAKIGFDNDPFSSFDAQPSHQDPFDPFGGGKPSRPSDRTTEDSSEDPFGCEPFSAVAPALPPKNKQPPPRPAPPRPAPPPAASGPQSQADSFADFSNFNSKFPSPQEISGELDFPEDPFKDYRYEDVFNIEDPFKDVTSSGAHAKSDSGLSESDPFSPSNSSASSINVSGKSKSSELLSDDNKKSLTNGFQKLFDEKWDESKVIKSDSLPNLLS